VRPLTVRGEQKTLTCTKLAVRNHDTGSADNFHLPVADLTEYQKQFVTEELKFVIMFQPAQTVQRTKCGFLVWTEKEFSASNPFDCIQE
jgi:hypothetical protein